LAHIEGHDLVDVILHLVGALRRRWRPIIAMGRRNPGCRAGTGARRRTKRTYRAALSRRLFF
jgi:hypothetical protein